MIDNYSKTVRHTQTHCQNYIRTNRALSGCFIGQRSTTLGRYRSSLSANSSINLNANLSVLISVFLGLALTTVPSLAMAEPLANAIRQSVSDSTGSTSLDISRPATGSLAIGNTSTDSYRNNYGNNSSLSSSANLPTLPNLGNGSQRFIEQHQHKALGEWSLRQLYANAPLLQDPWLQEELSRLTWQLNAQVRTQAPLALIVINNPNINAFAIPGGVIGINTGTVLAADSMDELASVVAHEVAHLSQRHYEHRSESDTKAMLIQMATLIAGAAAATVDSNAATAIIAGGQTAAQNGRMAFSRSNEREADRIGMQILAHSGFDPRAMPKFFATLNERNELNHNASSFLPSFVMTHPLTSERLSEAQTQANSYPNHNLNEYRSQPMLGTPNRQQLFDLLKWRTAVITHQAQETSLLTASGQSYGARLALATFYADKGRYVSADNALTAFDTMPVANRQSFEPLLSITKAHLAGKQGQWARAVDLLQSQHALYPERRDLRLYLAEALSRLQEEDIMSIQSQVEQLLSPLVEQVPHDIEALQRLQFAYEKMATEQARINDKSIKSSHNDNSSTLTPELATIYTIKALRYRSQYELWQAQFDKAQKSLQQAKRLATQLENSRINPKALLAKIDSEHETLEATKAFHP